MANQDPPAAQPPPPQTLQLTSPSRNRAVAWMPTYPGVQQLPPTEDWVTDPPESRHPQRHWSMSINDRRRLAVLGGREREREQMGPGGSPSPYSELAQLVAQLVSEGVDRDVLFPRPDASPEAVRAYQAFLARCAPFWQNMRRSPPS